MSLFCSLCNEIPQNPTVSPVSGRVFEKRLILKYLDEQGEVDPINGEKLTKDMLIDLKIDPSIQSQPPSASSIPGLLKCLQDEWDSIMLNNFSLRQQLLSLKQELSHTLYQHDASCRVIARLSQEVVNSREALLNMKSNSTNNFKTSKLSDQLKQPLGMTEDISQFLQNNSSFLTSDRKKRSKTGIPGVSVPDDIKEYKLTSSHSGLHSTANPGILCLDVSKKDQGKRIVTGGNDGNVVVFDKEKELIINKFKGHTKKVINVVFHPSEDFVISSSSDNNIRLWNINNEDGNFVLNAHDNSISDISIDATGRYLISGAQNGNWAFTDILSNQVILRVSEDEPYRGISCAEFHPDGLYFGLGNLQRTVRIWDIRGPTNVASFTGHTGEINSLSFSENGYYLASLAGANEVIIWDLRKSKDVHTIQLDQNYEAKSLDFDNNGICLAIGGTDVRVYRSKQWDLLSVYNENTSVVTDVKFSPNYLASSSMDRFIRFYGKSC